MLWNCNGIQDKLALGGFGTHWKGYSKGYKQLIPGFEWPGCVEDSYPKKTNEVAVGKGFSFHVSIFACKCCHLSLFYPW